MVVVADVAERYHKPKCPSCGGANVYHRSESCTFRCQRCGHVWPAPQEQPVEGDRSG